LAKKEKVSPHVITPSKFEESSNTQMNCGDSMQETSPHLHVPNEAMGDLNTYSGGMQGHSTMSASAFGDQDSEKLVSKFKEINISPTSGKLT
jgi:hypothetical protein